jgi:hypothetical protein
MRVTATSKDEIREKIYQLYGIVPDLTILNTNDVPTWEPYRIRVRLPVEIPGDKFDRQRSLSGHGGDWDEAFNDLEADRRRRQSEVFREFTKARQELKMLHEAMRWFQHLSRKLDFTPAEAEKEMQMMRQSSMRIVDEHVRQVRISENNEIITESQEEERAVTAPPESAKELLGRLASDGPVSPKEES